MRSYTKNAGQGEDSMSNSKDAGVTVRRLRPACLEYVHRVEALNKDHSAACGEGRVEDPG